MSYPKLCELCGYQIENEDDCIWWHGYGNCVEITDEMWAQWEREATQTDHHIPELAAAVVTLASVAIIIGFAVYVWFS